MKIEVRETTKPGMVQITTHDERWYLNQEKEHYRPSSTWIASYYPKGIELIKWIASKGWDEAEAIKHERGNLGKKVHEAIESLIKGFRVDMDQHFHNDKGDLEPLTVEEWECLMSFKEWFDDDVIEVIESEHTVENDLVDYAGTQDLKCRLKSRDGIGIVDYKTSSAIWPSMEIQVSSYKHADGNENVEWIAILQLNYKMNKLKKYKLTFLEDKFDLFLAARKIWWNENKDVRPKQREYPTSLTLKITKA